MDLYEYAKKAQQEDRQALEQMIKVFEPKVKYSLRAVPPEYRKDLEQELKMKLIEMILRYDLNSIPTFTEYIKANGGDSSLIKRLFK